MIGGINQLMGLFVAAFAATTLDTATRLQRYIVSEIAMNLKSTKLSQKHPATLIAVLSALILAFCSDGGKGALHLWPLFGAINQLLGGLALLVITVWLTKKGSPILITLIPMLFMITVTSWAMKINMSNFLANQNIMLFTIALIIIILKFWIIVEGILVLRKNIFDKKKNHPLHKN